ncbi:uncharacterized protein Z518_04720 [Rhinocladiella mackenziei CBS 650.93]|uniref:Pyridoxal phosphate homeostasis protein n=1 Tax=Rhinocladiella mackenziei CBS 650.93 TaxID=1442369 RepID=A0A0D2ILU5_9EURO|nr:uncharacterized protein Z518_04720 [Rhinocladiella mackenziei CBS 650.93]KIX06744.1 hypothetical protein Z518_04720 [Rhinocladiella mackenziei CBS 650.93]
MSTTAESELSSHSNTTPNTSTTTSEDSEASAMKTPVSINSSRASVLFSNIQDVRSRISSVLTSPPRASPASAYLPSKPPRLVAVSKLKPASDILALHTIPRSLSPAQAKISTSRQTEEPQRETETQTEAEPQLHFGENYVQELLEKSRLLPHSIRWHFIGGLQSNKCTALARDVISLWAVESVDSEKKAALLDKGRGERNARLHSEPSTAIPSSDSAGAGTETEARTEPGPLRVFIQINTSSEPNKSGLDPGNPELLSLARYIRNSCPNLSLQGVMTIGALARSQATTPETENEDFIVLRQTRDKLAKDLGMDVSELELSMGMSEDFEGAIRQGSNEVRVGSTIFGERPAKKDARIL